LKRELNETQSLYKQLVTENEKETFHERRVMLLKSQLIQMERQVMRLWLEIIIKMRSRQGLIKFRFWQ
jgi:ribosomal protein L17